ncbi:MAG TPA: OmpA family protein [Sphingopyxis sp.]|nr:OmpA family protein [Sphingopyxis sp.]
MQLSTNGPKKLMMIAMLGGSALMASPAWAQDPPEADVTTTIYGTDPVDNAALVEGPTVEGVITARRGDQLQITGTDGASTLISVTETTQIRASKGLFGLNRDKLAADALLNGLPVTIKTLQSGDQLVASQINLQNKDLKTASMIRAGTAQGFQEQAAATEALRGRMADIDKYNVKSTTNVHFNTGKATLSQQAKDELCLTAQSAEAMDNALLLVVGYTDSTGSAEVNQRLSERRAGGVVNYLQQSCGWKPYRMLTPTGMSSADPLASNDSVDGKAQNRRVSVNVLVSKGLDGL